MTRRPLLEWPFHPLLAPLPPLLALVHANRIMSDWADATQAVVVTWIGELLLLAALTPALRSLRTAAAVVSLATILFYSSHLIGPWEAPAWLGLGLLTVYFAVRPRSGEEMTTFANLVALIGVMTPLYTLYQDHRRPMRPREAPDRLESLKIAAPARPDLPDVFHVVLDGYGGPEILADRFGHASPLPEALRARGFSVAEGAHSNYIQTVLSFAATLNLDYLQQLLVGSTPRDRDRRAAAELCQDSRAVRAFRDAGYRIVEYPGEYSLTHQRLADERRRPWLHLTEFEYMLINRTPIQDLTALFGLPQSWLPHQIRRHHLRFVLDGLAEGDDHPGPTFTFAHLVAPHPPFIFEADGSYRPEKARAAFADGSTWVDLAEPFGETYRDGYLAQIRWLDAEIPRVIDGILARSPDAVILIQGDHGPGAGLDWRNLDRSDVGERTSILLAARLPGEQALPVGLTPVNAFRILFDALFDSDLPLLPDRTYFSTWDRPYTFVDVTDRHGAPPPITPDPPAGRTR